MTSATLLGISDSGLLAYLSREGLGSVFDPCDGRHAVFAGLRPGDDMQPADAREGVAGLVAM